MPTRICSKCSFEKELDCFTKNSKCLLGRTSVCKTCMNIWYRENYKKDPSKVYDKNKKSRAKRASEGFDIYKSIRTYRKNFPEKHNLKQKIRESMKRGRVPSWASSQDEEDIKNMYKLAQRLEQLCGVKYHVDHIVPLNGKNVCGLHTPKNLQILESSLNINKSNTHIW